MTRKKDQDLEKYLDGQSPLSRAYRSGRREEPPGLLDARIRREAHEAIGRKRKALRMPRWVPLAAAAVVVMSVSLLVFRFERHEPPLPVGGDVAAVPPEEKVGRIAAVPAKRGAEPASFPAERVDSRLKKELRDAPATLPAASPPIAESVAPAAKPDVKMTPASPAPADVSKFKQDSADRARQSRTEAVGTTTTGAQGVRAMAVERRAEQPKRIAAGLADVLNVTVSGEPGAYHFNVTIRSPDKGCAQYANWWEVVSEDGRLLYRRVLAHSHVDEQPFTRDGGPVAIGPDTVVWVRAHQHPQGYGGIAHKGSVRGGFRAAVPPAGFAASLAKTPPLLASCDF